jgi:hypothetical protein
LCRPVGGFDRRGPRDRLIVQLSDVAFVADAIGRVRRNGAQCAKHSREKGKSGLHGTNHITFSKIIKIQKIKRFFIALFFQSDIVTAEPADSSPG